MKYIANTPMELEGALNVRELGGYINDDNIQLREHKLLRGGDLSEMTESDMKKILSYGIHTCIDLRIDSEKKTADPFEKKPGQMYYAIPIEGKIDLSSPEDLLYKLYQSILEDYKQELYKVFQIVAREEGIIFHCAAGKDRTGVTAMLILALCGVCDEQIIADYVSSAENNRTQISKQKKVLEERGIAGVPEEIFSSNEYTMRKTLEYLYKRYGSAENYLINLGITEAEIEMIRSKMIGRG